MVSKMALEDQAGFVFNALAITPNVPKLDLAKNEDGTITSLVSKEEAQAREINTLVEEKFQGSLPAFVAAFTRRQDISDKELDEVQRMIDRIRKGG